MTATIETYLDVLEKRLVVLEQLSVGVRECQSAVTAMDLDRTLHAIDRQEKLCQKIRCLDGQLGGLQEALKAESGETIEWNAPQTLAEYLDDASRKKLQLLLIGFEKIETDIRRLNRVQSELLSRSRRSVSSLVNLMAHWQGSSEPRPMLDRELAPSSAGK